VGYARAGSSPAFDTIYEVHFFNDFGKLVSTTNSPFFVWCKLGPKFEHFLLEGKGLSLKAKSWTTRKKLGKDKKGFKVFNQYADKQICTIVDPFAEGQTFRKVEAQSPRLKSRITGIW
jgi:hypothetical protein